MCLGPNLGGIQPDVITQFEMFYVIMVQQDGLKVLIPCGHLMYCIVNVVVNIVMSFFIMYCIP